MVYSRAKMIKAIAAMAVSALCMTACGAVDNNYSVSEDTSGTKQKEPGSPSKMPAGEEAEDMGSSEDRGEESRGTNETKNPEKNHVKAGGINKKENVDSGIPVYRAGEEETVRKYLAGLPEQYPSFEEADQLGIIRKEYINTKQQEERHFGARWLAFYSKARESKEILAGKREKDIGTVYESAVVIVRCTTEGDPIYTYISYSYRDGKFYLYQDSSRDNFADEKSRKKGFSATYSDIKWRLAKGEDGQSTEFYLVKKGGVTPKKLEKMLAREEGYDIKEVCWSYSMEYVPDIVDGEVICIYNN